MSADQLSSTSSAELSIDSSDPSTPWTRLAFLLETPLTLEVLECREDKDGDRSFQSWLKRSGFPSDPPLPPQIGALLWWNSSAQTWQAATSVAPDSPEGLQYEDQLCFHAKLGDLLPTEQFLWWVLKDAPALPSWPTEVFFSPEHRVHIRHLEAILYQPEVQSELTEMTLQTLAAPAIARMANRLGLESSTLAAWAFWGEAPTWIFREERAVWSNYQAQGLEPPPPGMRAFQSQGQTWFLLEEPLDDTLILVRTCPLNVHRLRELSISPAHFFERLPTLAALSLSFDWITDDLSRVFDLVAVWLRGVPVRVMLSVPPKIAAEDYLAQAQQLLDQHPEKIWLQEAMEMGNLKIRAGIGLVPHYQIGLAHDVHKDQIYFRFDQSQQDLQLIGSWMDSAGTLPYYRGQFQVLWESPSSATMVVLDLSQPLAAIS
jgi:hypothetical protein